MAELPHMPVAVANLLADTAHMSTEERGAYFSILFTMWLHGGRVADDEKQLARIAGLSLRQWRAMAKVVCAPFTSAGGQLSQKRLTATWQDVQERRRKAAQSANHRWRAHDSHDRSHVRSHSARNANQRSNTESSDSEDGAAPARDASAPQEPPRGYQVQSPQLEQQLRRKPRL